MHCYPDIVATYPRRDAANTSFKGALSPALLSLSSSTPAARPWSLTHLCQHRLSSQTPGFHCTASKDALYKYRTSQGPGIKKKPKGRFRAGDVRFQIYLFIFYLWMTYLQTRSAAGEEGGVCKLVCCGMNTPLN